MFTFKRNKFWAFKQIGIAAGKLKSVEGLQFFKFLGTGGGSGFSLTPDFSTYAFLGVWNDRSQYNDCMNEHPVFLQYKEKASSQRELVLSPVNSHGKWSGKNPFKTPENPKSSFEDSNLKAVVITRATLRWNRLLSFWKAVPAASRAINNAQGVSYFKGIGELPFIQQATVSIWESFEAVNTFAYKGKEHATIVKETKQKKWYKEDLFSRFFLISDTTIKLN
ncbi:MAG: DUF3291 domain-containing protein [Flavobacteriaceae bacterium]|nr:DUF3291 domain-containing protein [Flavobacteriaceae bacterium]